MIRRIAGAALLVLLAGARGSLADDARVTTRTLPGGGLEISLEAPAPRLVAVDGALLPLVQGLHNLGASGQPDLPEALITIEVPLDADLSVRTVEPPRWETLAVTVPVAGAASLTGDAPFGEGSRTVRERDPEVYAAPGWYPAEPAVIERLGSLRGRALARVRLRPVQASPTTGEIRYLRGLRVEVTSSGGTLASPDAAGPLDDAAARVLRDVPLLAAASASERPRTRVRETFAVTATQEDTLASSMQPVMLRVSEAGIQAVSPADLAAAGVDLTGVDPTTFRLTRMGAEVPIEVTGEGDGVFDPSDRILFYGEPLVTAFSYTSSYRLTSGGAPGLRFTTRDVTPSGSAPPAVDYTDVRHLEEDSYYTQNAPPAAITHWWWDATPASEDPTNLFPPYQTEGTTETFDLTLANVSTGGGTGRIRVNLQGRTSYSSNPDHHTRIRLNGTLVDDRTWDGVIPFTHDVAVSQALFVEGLNTIAIESPGDTAAPAEHHYINWIEVEYRDTYVAEGSRLIFEGDGTGVESFAVSGFAEAGALILDVSDPPDPVRLTGGSETSSTSWTVTFDDDASAAHRYAAASASGRLTPAIEIDAPSDWADPANGADLIVVVHDSLAAAVQPLVDHRLSQGLRVAKVLVSDVYDEFNGGDVNPSAIRDLVQYAYDNWQPPAPSFLLLVGDGTPDYRHDLGGPDASLIPIHIVYQSGFGDLPSDNWFATVDGTDKIPDLSVGRLPVGNPSDLTTVVDKILDYETAGPDPDVADQVLLVADDDVVQFESTSNALSVNYVPPAMSANKVYRSQLTVGATRAAIDQGFDDGALLANYYGHGNLDVWGKEIFWLNGDAQALSNGTRLPFVTSLNCINGYFAIADGRDCMAEIYLKNASGGAVGAWAPTALGAIDDYDYVVDRLYAKLFDDHLLTMGTATTESLVESYLLNGIQERNLESMTFIGDPAMHLQADSDLDGLGDEAEVALGSGVQDADTDDDGLVDADEPSPGGDHDADGLTNLLDPDSDDDGLPDGLEAGRSSASAGTDVAAGWFLPDADAGATTTDPIDADSDGGGVADGAEDRNRNGQVDGLETDPRNPADDDPAACAPPPLPVVSAVSLTEAGDDLVLSWADLAGTHPCVLYRVYGAPDDGAPKDDPDAFSLLAVTPETSWVHRGAGSDGSSWDYLVVSWTLADDEGPLEHYGR